MDIDDFDVATRHACKILPAWFIPRMMCDEWRFGLLLTTGHVMCISTITHFHSCVGGEWIDVDMLEDDCMWVNVLKGHGMNVICAPTSRCTASVQVNQIVAAFELADT